MWMWVVGGVALIGVLVLLVLYNGLIVRRNACVNAFATIDVMLQKRYDLIPNLVSAVKGYARHEAAVFTQVTELRAKALAGLPSDESVRVNNEITRALGKLIAVAENYPQLRASENFMHLQRTLTEIEEQLSAARRAFNAAVTEFNNAVETVPSNIVAGWMGLARRELLETREEQREPPNVARSGDGN